MTEELILSEIHQLPESLKLEVLHFARFLRQEKTQIKKTNQEAEPPESRERVFGISKGRYKLAPDFDAPLDNFKY